MKKGNLQDESWFESVKQVGILGIFLFLGLRAILFSPDIGDALYSAEHSDLSTFPTGSVKESQHLHKEIVHTPCLTPELDGQWVLDTNKTFADPFCCEGDDKLFVNNPPQCLNTRPIDNFVGLSDKLSLMRGRGCRCEFRDTYTWKSNALDSAVFDPHDFCRLLGDRRILLVGDSTVSQASTTLMNSVFPGGCQTQMAFVLSDTLIIEEMGALNRGVYWTDAIARHEPNIVILSSGPHIYGLDNYTRVHETLMADISILRQTTNITFVWKTQQAAGCSDQISLQHPFVSAQEMLKGPMEYNHADFFARDLFSIQVMQQNNIPFLDLRMLYSRSEAHISHLDCLHFCSPGPLDIFPSLLHRMLKTNFEVSQCIN